MHNSEQEENNVHMWGEVKWEMSEWRNDEVKGVVKREEAAWKE